MIITYIFFAEKFMSLEMCQEDIAQVSTRMYKDVNFNGVRVDFFSAVQISKSVIINWHKKSNEKEVTISVTIYFFES